MYSPIERAASWNPEYHVTRAALLCRPCCRRNTRIKGLRYSAPGHGETSLDDARRWRCVQQARYSPRPSENGGEWARNIKREDKVLDETCVVCSCHFDERYIEKTFKHIINSELVELDRERPVLTDDAVPTIFPDAPSYLTRPVAKKRKERNLADRGTPPLKRRAASGSTHDCDPGNACTETAPETHPFNDILPPSMYCSRIVSSNDPTALCFGWHARMEPDDPPLHRRAHTFAPYIAEESKSKKTFKHIINSELVELDRERPVLTDDAVPTIFPDAPSYLTRRTRILLEATILAEKSGLFVDFWTSDGAPWNRCLWKLLGIKGERVLFCPYCSATSVSSALWRTPAEAERFCKTPRLPLKIARLPPSYSAPAGSSATCPRHRKILPLLGRVDDTRKPFLASVPANTRRFQLEHYIAPSEQSSAILNAISWRLAANARRFQRRSEMHGERRAASWNPEYHVTRAELLCRPCCRKNTRIKGLRYSAP
ncbi:hypothetical protein HPB47_025099 [Ixodes persulcatus]|uniref:Uncharacterized protein n=1 Tax=Ixodes persulcatus TaxID=34615 RepID=A0AC60Q2T4_IXOPE|nr:hypothetical protein HPB47_025099 [Ixodes persulcatus]